MAMQLLPDEFAVNIKIKQQFYRQQKYHAVGVHESYRSYQSIQIFYVPAYAAILGQSCHVYELTTRLKMAHTEHIKVTSG